MAKYLLAIITLLLNFGICNADTLRGMVKDSNGNPIVFAQISLCGKQAKTYSNNDGFWILPAASPSDTVAVSHFRFQPIKRIVGSSNTMDIVLQKAPIQLEPVTISTSKAYFTVRSAIKKISSNYLADTYTQGGIIRERLYLNDTLQYFSDAELELTGSYTPQNSNKATAKRLQAYQSPTDNPLSIVNSSSIAIDMDEVKVRDKILSDASLRLHNFSIKEIEQKDGKQYYSVKFTPTKNRGIRYHGEMYIETKSLAITYIKIEAEGLSREGSALLEAYYAESDGKYWLKSCLVKKNESRTSIRGKQQFRGEVLAVMDEPTLLPIAKEQDEKKGTGEENARWNSVSGKSSNHRKALAIDSTLQNELQRLQRVTDTVAYTKLERKGKLEKEKLYEPSLTLLFSSKPSHNLLAFNTTYSSFNRLAMYKFGNMSNNEALNTGAQILFDMYLSIPLQGAEAERKLLSMHGIKALYNPTPINRYLSSYCFNVSNNELNGLKAASSSDFVRLHTLQEECSYSTTRNIEEELFTHNIERDGQRDDFVKYYYPDLFIRRLLLITPIFTSSITTSIPSKKGELDQPIFANRMASYVHSLLNPNEPINRNISNEDLTSKEKDHLRRMRLLSLQNLISPLAISIPPFKLGSSIQYSFSLGYRPSILGDCFSQNLWLKTKQSAYRITFTEYKSNTSTSYGVGFKVIDADFFINGKLSTEVNYWKQPSNLSYYPDSYTEGFSVSQMAKYKLGRFAVALGYTFKTKGYLELSDNLGSDISLYYGLSYSFSNLP